MVPYFYRAYSSTVEQSPHKGKVSGSNPGRPTNKGGLEMIIDWLKYNKQDHVIAWFLGEAMSSKNTNLEKSFPPFDSSQLDVKLTINGVEVNFVKVMDFLQAQLHARRLQGVVQGRDEVREEVKDNLDRMVDVIRVKLLGGGLDERFLQPGGTDEPM